MNAGAIPTGQAGAGYKPIVTHARVSRPYPAQAGTRSHSMAINLFTGYGGRGRPGTSFSTFPAISPTGAHPVKAREYRGHYSQNGRGFSLFPHPSRQRASRHLPRWRAGTPSLAASDIAAFLPVRVPRSEERGPGRTLPGRLVAGRAFSPERGTA